MALNSGAARSGSVLLQKFRSLAGVGLDLLLAAGARLGEARQQPQKENHPQQDNGFFCPHVAIVWRTRLARSSHAKRKDGGTPPSLSSFGKASCQNEMRAFSWNCPRPDRGRGDGG